MASDLEGLYDHYRARGLDEDDAARRAEEKLLASPEALEHLIAVHTTGLERWLQRTGDRLRWGLDAVLFVVAVAPVVVVAALAVAAGIGGIRPGPAALALVAGAAWLSGIGLWKAYQLFVKRPISTLALRRGLSTVVWLGIMGPVVGGMAFLWGLSRTAADLMTTGSAAAQTSEAGRALTVAQVAAAERIAQDATLFAMGLLLGFGAGVLWFVLHGRIARIEQAESAAMLAE